jgi:4-hydroxy-tetrahydrodipicolinate reductase
MDATILGDGGLGRAIEAALRERGDAVRVIGRPPGGRHRPDALAGADVVIDASRGEAVAANVEVALAAGVRRLVIGTTGWERDRDRVERRLVDAGAAAVAAPNLSLGAALFFRLVDEAAALFGGVEAFDPYLLEWHRRAKRDRPSGTARELARRIVARHPTVTADDLEVAVVRAGSSPGMHLVGFDAPGETIELRLTARDRSAYAAGALAAADWLVRTTRPAGLHAFDPVVDELVRRPLAAAVA